ncbi:unnamed protein product, partial [Amoebophrya sp. A25]
TLQHHLLQPSVLAQGDSIVREFCENVEDPPAHGSALKSAVRRTDCYAEGLAQLMHVIKFGGEDHENSGSPQQQGQGSTSKGYLDAILDLEDTETGENTHEFVTWDDAESNLRSITFAVATGFYSRHRVKYVVQKARDQLGCRDESARAFRQLVWEECDCGAEVGEGGELSRSLRRWRKEQEEVSAATLGSTLQMPEDSDAERTGEHNQEEQISTAHSTASSAAAQPLERRCILILRHGRFSGQRQWTNLDEIVHYFEDKIGVQRSPAEDCLKEDHEIANPRTQLVKRGDNKISLHVLRMIDLTPCDQVRIMRRAILVV